MILPESCRLVRGSGTKKTELALEQDTEKISVGRCSRNFPPLHGKGYVCILRVRLFLTNKSGTVEVKPFTSLQICKLVEGFFIILVNSFHKYQS